MHKLTIRSGLINFHRSKKKHNTIMSADKVKKHVRKDSCITVSESIQYHQGSRHSEMFNVSAV